MTSVTTLPHPTPSTSKPFITHHPTWDDAHAWVTTTYNNNNTASHKRRQEMLIRGCSGADPGQTSPRGLGWVAS